MRRSWSERRSTAVSTPRTRARSTCSMVLRATGGSSVPCGSPSRLRGICLGPPWQRQGGWSWSVRRWTTWAPSMRVPSIFSTARLERSSGPSRSRFRPKEISSAPLWPAWAPPFSSGLQGTPRVPRTLERPTCSIPRAGCCRRSSTRPQTPGTCSASRWRSEASAHRRPCSSAHQETTAAHRMRASRTSLVSVETDAP